MAKKHVGARDQPKPGSQVDGAKFPGSSNTLPGFKVHKLRTNVLGNDPQIEGPAVPSIAKNWPGSKPLNLKAHERGSGRD